MLVVRKAQNITNKLASFDTFYEDRLVLVPATVSAVSNPTLCLIVNQKALVLVFFH